MHPGAFAPDSGRHLEASLNNPGRSAQSGFPELRLAHSGFSSFATYAWYESEQTIKEEDPLGHERVMDAVDGQMSAKGFRKVGSSPDVYVTYNAEVDEQVRIDTTYMDTAPETAGAEAAAWEWARPHLPK